MQNQTRTEAILQRLPSILHVTATSFGLPVEQAHHAAQRLLDRHPSPRQQPSARDLQPPFQQRRPARLPRLAFQD